MFSAYWHIGVLAGGRWGYPFCIVGSGSLASSCTLRSAIWMDGCGAQLSYFVRIMASAQQNKENQLGEAEGFVECACRLFS